MRKKAFVLLTGVCAVLYVFAQPQDPFERYIDKYKDLAIFEMQRAGIPASIKLGQALIESDAGRSDLARKANNHFGIKCNTDWEGKTFFKKDDDYNDQGEHIKSCFRVYEDAEASFRGHSEFLRNPKKQFRYGQLFELDTKDYKGWAEGLRRAGYATSPTYSQRLVQIIERYKLYKYDHMTIPEDQPFRIASNDDLDSDLAGFMVQNDVKYILSRDNEPVEEIARRTHTPVRSLMAYNENLKNSTQRLIKDTKVYLQPKRSAYRGKKTYHTVQMGETMFEIAQEYGLRLDKLYERNRMTSEMEPAYNEHIKLRGGKVKTRPQIVIETPPSLQVPTPEKDSVTLAPPTPTPPPVQVPLVEVIENKETVNLEKPADNQPVTVDSPPASLTDNASATSPAKVVNNPQPHPQSDFDTSDIFKAPTTEKPSAPAQETNTYHTVVKGDTLWNISQRYGSNVDAVKRLNNLTSNDIKLGQRLRVR